MENRPTRMEILKERHQMLDDEVDRLNKKSYLSPSDSSRLKSLKVRRLRCKDAIRILSDEYNV
tara:strand:- start:207 stop:395 length:189 start_codon:yes stop_codon:yes gene_type:complete